MTSPIPINPDATSARQTSPPGLSTTNPGSSASSISPHTPFFPPPGLASSATPTQPSSLFKWAASFGRSPPKPPTIGVDSSQKKAGTEGAEHENVPFEFGDFRDTNAQSWANGRRAMSVSAPYGGPGQSGITELLRNNGSYSPTEPKGVMADKVARGQGVLRRLSMGGYKVSSTAVIGRSDPLTFRNRVSSLHLLKTLLFRHRLPKPRLCHLPLLPHPPLLALKALPRSTRLQPSAATHVSGAGDTLRMQEQGKGVFLL